jgi:hypothetical protein
MRQCATAAAVAVGLIALWAAVLPLTGKPAAKQVATRSPAISKALFLCHGQNGLDQGCVRALEKALLLDAKSDAATQVSGRSCPADQQGFANLNRRD